MLKVNCKLKKFMKENNLTQKDLSNATGIRQASISEMSNNMRRSINIDHLEKIINTYKINTIDELIEITKL